MQQSNIFISTQGRLANVLYEICAAVTYCKRHNLSHNKISLKTIFSNLEDKYKRASLLKVLENSGIKITFVLEVPKNCTIINEDNFLKDIPLNENICFKGYFQNNDFIDYDYIKSLITVPKDIKETILNLYPNVENSVVCHVRRKDYFKYPDVFVTLNAKYIHQVYNKYFKTLHLIVVSDDIEWCQENLSDISNVTFSEQNELIDLMTIMLARGIICSASSFSTIGAVLNNNPNKQVIMIDTYYKNNLVAEHIPDDFILEPLEEKTIAIYYIATNTYKQYFKGFYKTLKYFLPGYKKTVILMTDDSEDIYKKANIVWNHIDHYPWPIITLYKMYLIKNHFYNATYHFYVNANALFKKETDSSKVLTDKLTCSFLQLNGKNPYNEELPYIQGGFFGGPTNIFNKMCTDIINAVNDCLNKQHSIPEYHDETLLNQWYAEHTESCSIIYIYDYVKLTSKKSIDQLKEC